MLPKADLLRSFSDSRRLNSLPSLSLFLLLTSFLITASSVSAGSLFEPGSDREFAHGELIMDVEYDKNIYYENAGENITVTYAFRKQQNDFQQDKKYPIFLFYKTNVGLIANFRNTHRDLIDYRYGVDASLTDQSFNVYIPEMNKNKEGGYELWIYNSKTGQPLVSMTWVQKKSVCNQPLEEKAERGKHTGSIIPLKTESISLCPSDQITDGNPRKLSVDRNTTRFSLRYRFNVATRSISDNCQETGLVLHRQPEKIKSSDFWRSRGWRSWPVLAFDLKGTEYNYDHLGSDNYYSVKPYIFKDGIAFDFELKKQGDANPDQFFLVVRKSGCKDLESPRVKLDIKPMPTFSTDYESTHSPVYALSTSSRRDDENDDEEDASESSTIDPVPVVAASAIVGVLIFGTAGATWKWAGGSSKK